MRIKELADATAVPVDTIRHYEKAGLLGAPKRSHNNYRRYGEDDAQRLRFIRNCRTLDLSLDEVRVLLGFIDHPAGDCSPVDAVVEAHLAHVRERLHALRLLERQLETLRRACGQAKPQAACGIVLALSADAPSPVRPKGGGVRGR